MSGRWQPMNVPSRAIGNLTTMVSLDGSMAVFTEVSFAEAAALFARLNAGALTGLTGIAAGVQNTNYFADSTTGRYVLTLFERMGRSELPFYLELMRHLARRAIPVPDPLADAGGALLHELSGKPAVVVHRLPGQPQLTPDAEHCAAVGAMLARMHLSARDAPLGQDNPRGLAWWLQTAPQLSPYISAKQRDLLESELSFQAQVAGTPGHLALPRGPIHADLFRDNVLFEGHKLTGLLDFYFAAVDAFVFDIAVCLNDWCTELTTGRLLEDRAGPFVAAYAGERALTPDEHALLPAALRAAALRFWISRLFDLHLPRNAALLEPRDPSHFERMLRRRRT
jgi:homoserine kinase type II